MARIKKKIRRNHTFHYISRYIGKGGRENIKQLHIINTNSEVDETLIKREEIEDRIKQHNINHFKKVHNSIACKDKMHKRLRHNTIRDKILNRTLQREECNDKKVY